VAVDIENMGIVYEKPDTLTSVVSHYCPGCTHGVIHRLVAEVIDELGLREKTIGVASVGCSVFSYNYLDLDFAQAPHGRAPAMATGIKRVHPERIVFTYQGDGDLASIGTAEIVHAATRSENITVIFVNNGVYGMTGGQMAPTTLPGMTTTSSPLGRDVRSMGYPVRASEMLATLDGPLGPRPREHQQDPQGHQDRVSGADQRPGLLHGGGPLDVPGQLEPDARELDEVFEGEHDPLLPAWRLQSIRRSEGAGVTGRKG
jgi:hypothetical protein